MRTLLLPAVLTVLGLTTGCGVTGDDDGAGRSSGAPSSSATPSSSPTPSGSPFTPAPARPDVITSDACARVRAGIDAFNTGAYAETVRQFAAAVPLAERRADGSQASNELVAAVRYYARLAPDEYAAAARSSEAFARNKAITLTQCAGGPPATPGEGDSPSEPGLTT